MLVGEDYWDDEDVSLASAPPNWQDKALKFPYTKHKDNKIDPIASFLQTSDQHIRMLVALYKVSVCFDLCVWICCHRQTTWLMAGRHQQAAVREVDSAVGVLVNALKQIGIEHNTLIVYTSDHGSMLGSHGLMYVHT